jgi:RNAse (barnase) inhibitor barstar
MYKLDRMVAGELAPGIYRYAAGEHPANVSGFLARFDWCSFYLDGRLITDKTTFLERVAVAMGFPEYVGRNWDAFEEAIRDLVWTPASGYLLIYDYPQVFASAHPEDWQTLLSILQEAIDYWQEQDIPMFVLLRKTGGSLGEIPRL